MCIADEVPCLLTDCCGRGWKLLRMYLMGYFSIKPSGRIKRKKIHNLRNSHVNYSLTSAHDAMRFGSKIHLGLMEGVAAKGKRALAFFQSSGAQGSLGAPTLTSPQPFSSHCRRRAFPILCSARVFCDSKPPRFSFLSPVTDLRRTLESIALALTPTPQRVNRGRVALQLYRAISSFQRA
jgi:hypothetical protein